MVRKNQVYSVAYGAALVLTFAGVILWYAPAGQRFLPESVPEAPLFVGPVSPFVIVAVVLVGGKVLVGRLRRRGWLSAGRTAGLSAEGSGLFGAPDLQGTRRGRSVRAFVHRESAGGSSRRRSSRRYTVVEADLAEPAGDGAVVSPLTDGGPAVRPFEVAPNADAGDDRIAAVGGSEAAAETVVSGRPRESLLALEHANQAFVGDAGAALETLPERSGVIGGENLDVKRAVERHYEDGGGGWTGDPGTVTHVTRGLVLDGDELDRQVDAVVALAEAFERADRRIGATAADESTA